ncbi:GNAT family N-acetyltransferase [bacterium]|nr:GNAT family N-acetyltransferase [bacterium]MBQ9150058.1 GNAT family N-acetyltransferase [bacterium]
MLELSKITSGSSKTISLLAEMIKEIWAECLLKLHGRAVVNYLLYFVKEDALKIELKNEKFEYYFIEWNKEKIGFILLEDMDDVLNVSRFYIKEEYRNRGIGFKVFQRILVYAKKRKYKFIYLYINRKNFKALRFFQRLGFLKKCSVVRYIGSEKFLDDYKFIYEL